MCRNKNRILLVFCFFSILFPFVSFLSICWDATVFHGEDPSGLCYLSYGKWVSVSTTSSSRCKQSYHFWLPPEFLSHSLPLYLLFSHRKAAGNGVCETGCEGSHTCLLYTESPRPGREPQMWQKWPETARLGTQMEAGFVFTLCFFLCLWRHLKSQRASVDVKTPVLLEVLKKQHSDVGRGYVMVLQARVIRLEIWRLAIKVISKNCKSHQYFEFKIYVQLNLEFIAASSYHTGLKMLKDISLSSDS